MGYRRGLIFANAGSSIKLHLSASYNSSALSISDPLLFASSDKSMAGIGNASIRDKGLGLLGSVL